jgi:hypothetical protein
MKTNYGIFPALISLLISFSCLAGEAEDQFIERYRVAYESGKADALIELVYPEGVTGEVRKLLESSFQFNLDMNMVLSDITMGEVPEDTEVEQTVGDVTYKLNLEPVFQMRVSSSMKDNEGKDTETLNSYLLGKHEGRLYITIGVPVESPEPSHEEPESNPGD